LRQAITELVLWLNSFRVGLAGLSANGYRTAPGKAHHHCNILRRKEGSLWERVFSLFFLLIREKKFLRSPQALYLIGHKQVAHKGQTKQWEKGKGVAMVGIYQL